MCQSTRRRFDEALSILPQKDMTSTAGIGLRYINKLFKIEEEIRNLCSNEIYTAPSMDLEQTDAASARCSLGAVVMSGVGAVYWAGAVAVYAAVVISDVILVT